jgi:hypothetical protein
VCSSIAFDNLLPWCDHQCVWWNSEINLLRDTADCCCCHLCVNVLLTRVCVWYGEELTSCWVSWSVGSNPSHFWTTLILYSSEKCMFTKWIHVHKQYCWDFSSCSKSVSICWTYFVF